MRVDDLHPREQEFEVGFDDLVDRDELVRLYHQQARQDLRHLDPGEHALVGLRIAQPDRDRQAERGDVRERVAGIDGERCEHREDLIEEPLPQRLVVLRHRVVVDDRHTLGGQALAEVEEDRRVLGDELEHALPSLRELLCRRATVRRAGDGPGLHLLAQPGDADLEELVEVAGKDRRELHAFEERVALVPGFVQDPRVELEPRQLAVQVGELRSCSLGLPSGARRDRSLGWRSWIYGHASERLLDLRLAGEDSTAL